MMNKGKRNKIGVFVVMALLIAGMVFLVVRNKRVVDYNEDNTPFHAVDTTTTVLTN